MAGPDHLADPETIDVPPLLARMVGLPFGVDDSMAPAVESFVLAALPWPPPGGDR